LMIGMGISPLNSSRPLRLDRRVEKSDKTIV